MYVLVGQQLQKLAGRDSDASNAYNKQVSVYWIVLVRCVL
jgi:hypothetical protein